MLSIKCIFSRPVNMCLSRCENLWHFFVVSLACARVYLTLGLLNPRGYSTLGIFLNSLLAILFSLFYFILSDIDDGSAEIHVIRYTLNRPFPKSLWPLFQSESWWSSFHMHGERKKIKQNKKRWNATNLDVGDTEEVQTSVEEQKNPWEEQRNSHYSWNSA